MCHSSSSSKCYDRNRAALSTSRQRWSTNPSQVRGAAVQIMLKGGLNAVTRALAIEYAKEGIRVNTIAPGVIDTPMHKPETHQFLKGLQPVGRIGEVQEVVDAALFLTDATFTSGEVLHVDGGAHAGKW